MVFITIHTLYIAFTIISTDIGWQISTSTIISTEIGWLNRYWVANRGIYLTSFQYCSVYAILQFDCLYLLVGSAQDHSHFKLSVLGSARTVQVLPTVDLPTIKSKMAPNVKFQDLAPSQQVMFEVLFKEIAAVVYQV
jgi:hypothetical protein